MTTPDQNGSRPVASRPLVIVFGGLVVGLIVVAFLLAPSLQARFVQDTSVSQPFNTGVSGIPSPFGMGKMAPDFTLSTLDGGKVTLSDLRGQAVLINFWATWCGPCRLEMPELVRAYQTYEGDGLIVLALNTTTSDSLTDVRAFAEEFRLPFPILLDETGRVSGDLYRVSGLPKSIFIDRKGIIARVYLGAMTRKQIDQFVTEILE